MELYTSLVRLKQVMNNGALPPMMPVPVSAQAVIDPAFTIGLGALVEDEKRGLRCPVRGCGLYMHRLDMHLRYKHPGIGGVDTVRRLLSLPKTAPLMSQYCRRLSSELGKRYHSALPVQSTEVRRVIGSRGGLSRTRTVGERNLRDRCEAQLAHRIIDVANRLGRSPTSDEFIAMTKNGSAVMSEIYAVFGTWSSAKAQCGLKVYRPSVPVDQSDVLPALAAWHEQHGSLPSARDAMASVRVPAIPTYRTVLRAMKRDSWRDAMELAASLLNIYGGRYGLPERKAVA